MRAPGTMSTSDSSSPVSSTVAPYQRTGHLCLSEIRSGHIRDAIRRVKSWHSRRCEPRSTPLSERLWAASGRHRPCAATPVTSRAPVAESARDRVRDPHPCGFDARTRQGGARLFTATKPTTAAHQRNGLGELRGALLNCTGHKLHCIVQ